jgi:glycolate oxidase iron-sulfur subunit
MDALYLYQATGMAEVVRRTGLARVVGMQAQEAMAPRVPPLAARRGWPTVLPPHGKQRARVLFLRGCVMPELLPEVQRDSIEVLRRNGCEVVTPAEQTCCGALHFHTGERARGLELLRQNLRALDPEGFDALVVNAAGCGSTLKEYGTLAAEDVAIAASASAFAARVRDLSEFLHDLGLVPPEHPVPLRIAYDEPCHLLHGQRISIAPKAILAAIPGAVLVPLADADRCCGSAGVYNLIQPELATAVLDEKVRAIAASGAQVVATGNPGCILWIRRGLAAAAKAEPRLAGVRVMHPMELLARAYRGA